MEISGARKFYRSCSTRSSTKPVANLPKSSYSSPTPPPHRSPLWEGAAGYQPFESVRIGSPKLSLSSPTETERCLSEYNTKAPKSPRSPRSPSARNHVAASPKSPTIFQFGPQSPSKETDSGDYFAMSSSSGMSRHLQRLFQGRHVNENKPYHSLDSDSQTVSTSACSTMTTSLSSRHSSLKEKRGRRRQLPSPNDSSTSTPTEQPKVHRCRKSTSDLTDMTDDVNTTTTALSRSGSRKGSKGNLAYLASRRGSRGSRESISSVVSNASNEGLGPLNFQHPRNRQRRTSNFLELPVPDHIRPRVCSLPEKTINPRLSDDLYRLRTFSITNKGVVNCGDSIINRRSRSNTSVNSITSRSNVSGERSPFDGSCCGSGYHSVGSDSFDSTDEVEVPKYRVVTLGDAGVGKTALVSQFMTSEYMNTYDASLGKTKDDEFGERTVSILLDGQESEMVFIDHPASEMSVENSLSTYEPHACIVVYSVTSRSTFQTAEEILNYLWKENCTRDKSVIVVGNKADLARARVITQNEGKCLAVAKDCKFIETSSGIQHNVDELLVGILKQIRLRETLEKKKSMTKEKSKMKGSKTSLRLHFAKEILQKICLNDISKSKSCENLHVL
ncbi:uncharacterized protein LOC109534119 isoform X1 [Dendroctonus ponderosae]|uniref:uncharacterized protein LOC109534119 isoform X1 n=1 Tax=Dendroctonus ponderosae TaxID=77166 RepID=UPI00203579D0|nr:uncharacterized protein LOC109534119 isoform X1 [Dendroctonus ponderosae]XP_048523679.1 uncharacterized protein LOC109534119 isoform X1 [Dendroctonus ponderosae]